MQHPPGVLQKSYVVMVLNYLNAKMSWRSSASPKLKEVMFFVNALTWAEQVHKSINGTATKS